MKKHYHSIKSLSAMIKVHGYTGILLIILFVIPFQASLSAQVYYPFATDTAQWSIKYTVSYANTEPIIRTYHLKLKGDTTIDGLLYEKIYQSSVEDYFSDSTEYLKCFIREDSKKVYVKYPLNSPDFPDTAAFVLYDFNLQLGDTFTTKMVNINENINEADFEVLSFDSINTNTGYRRTMNLELISFGSGTPIMYCYDTVFHWMEGIGSQLSPFYNEVFKDCYWEWHVYHKLICYHENFNYLFGGADCDTVSGFIGVEEHKEEVVFELYPNPLDNEGVIKFNKGPSAKSIEINFYDLQGRKAAQYKGSGKEIKIKKGGLSSGVYLAEIFLDQKYSGHIKVLIK